MAKEIIKMKLRSTTIYKKCIYITLGICIGLDNHWFKNPIVEIPLMVIRGLITPLSNNEN